MRSRPVPQTASSERVRRNESTTAFKTSVELLPVSGCWLSRTAVSNQLSAFSPNKICDNLRNLRIYINRLRASLAVLAEHEHELDVTYSARAICIHPVYLWKEKTVAS